MRRFNPYFQIVYVGVPSQKNINIFPQLASLSQTPFFCFLNQLQTIVFLIRTQNINPYFSLLSLFSLYIPQNFSCNFNREIMSSNHHHHQHHQGDGMEAVPFSTTFDASANHEQQPPVMASVGAAEAGGGGGEIWLDGREEELDENLLVDVSDSSIFYTDFPPLPDFPCMSSSSSTSSSAPTSAKPLHAKSSCSTSSSSSSSAVSWTAFNNPQPQHFEGTDQRKRRHYDHSSGGDAASAALISTASMEIDLPPPDQDCISEDVDCINVMENFGYMDLLDNNDIWDPCSIFQFENPQEDEQQAAAQQQQQKDEDGGNEHDQLYFLQGNSELAVIFLEWLKQNREYISAEDMRNIKLKRSTIECASKRLGSTKEGKKQLLKLILEWVEQYQLQRKRVKETVSSDSPNYHHFHQHHHQESSPSFQPANNPNPNPNSDLNCNAFPHPQDPNNPCFPPPGNWMPAPPPYAPESPFPAMGGFVCDPYGNGPGQNMYPPPSEYQPQMDCYQQQPQFAMAPQYSQFPDNSSGGAPVYGSPYPYPLYDGNGERLMRLGSSATKEARKKRMARQRRLSIHQYRHHHNHQNQNQLQQVQGDELNAIGNSEDQNCNSNNWVYWPTPNVPCSSAVPNNLVAPAPGDCDIRSNMQQQNQRQPLSDRREVLILTASH